MTEMITGIDLIQEQIRAAQGEVLRFKQEDIQIKACLLAHTHLGSEALCWILRCPSSKSCAQQGWNASFTS